MKDRSRTNYAIINIFTGLAGYAVTTIIGFVCRMVFVRCLSQEYLGINGLFTNILSILSLAELGIGSAIVFALYKPLAENDDEKSASLIKFYSSAYKVIGIVIAFVGVALIPFLDKLIGEPVQIKENLTIIYVVFLFNTTLSYFFSYKSSIFMANQRNYVSTGLSYLISLIQNLVQIGVLLLTKNYYLYLSIQIISTISYNLIISYLANKQYPNLIKKNAAPLSKPEKKSLIVNIKALTVNKLTDILVNSTDNIIITYFSGLITVGAASNYTLLSSTLSTITNQIFNSLTASVGNFNAKESKERQFEFYQILQFANFMIFGLATIGIVFVSSDLVGLFFGKDYILSQEIPFVIALNFYLVTMQSSITTFRSTLGLFKYGQYTLIFTAAFNLIFSIWLGNVWGLFGIYIATSIARILTNAWYLPYTIFKHGFNKNPILYFKKYFLYSFLTVAVGLICFYIFKHFDFGFLINVIVKSAVCICLWSLMIIICFRKTKEYKYLKLKLINLIAARKK